ncbi:ankyrin repeat-containing protein ITN1-like [Pyrus communis]|uniref:ankyrin repeat-containing protein ITN1-like n=1 Tax=Pyrus communis TaxID=23211 RepID=UPI0035BEF586
MLCFMRDVVELLNHQKMRDGLVYEAVYSAVQNGTVEIVKILCEARPELLFRGLEDGKNIFHYAVECRQENVYSLIYEVGKRNLITTLRDNSDNSILHYAGMLSPLASKKLDGIAGAALQMQRERQWYKEVESIVVPLSRASNLNKDGLTPPQLFTEEHKELLEGGERWMRSAAKSYTVVNALIITIMFAAAFTVPGGNNQVTGFPIFLKGKVFMVFIGSDAISLFSSATSALIFLGILTSRYTEDDFLKSLPTKMILGLSSLLISIATMMVAFSSALFIMFQDKSWFTYPFIFLANIPVTLFIWMQFPLLVKIFKSTYCERVFDRKIKHWI